MLSYPPSGADVSEAGPQMYPIDEMISFLQSRGQSADEGSSSPQQQDYLRQLVGRSHARLVGEIGFNAGFSSLAFLSADPGVRVVSFDIGQHEIVRHAKEFLDEIYPGRHELITGDSTATVPRYAADNPAVSFDLVFIDGGHRYETVAADIANMRSTSHLGTSVVIDDLTPWLWWGEGPTRAWTEAIGKGRITQVEIFKDGEQVQAIAPPGERSWALGFYL
jgi:predicted O-methyltransferase YrrM